MNVLVTGGAGYIGSVVAEELIHAGCRVVVYDNLSRGHPNSIPTKATFIQADLLETSSVVEALRGHSIDVVVHMAAHSIVSESMSDPASYYRANVEASLSLLEAMRQTNTRRLVFSSTAAVYGDPDKLPITETDVIAPTNTYGQTKLAVEQALPWYELAYGLRWTSLRYFNAAGATKLHGERHDPETHLIPLVLQVAAGTRSSITVFGNDYPTFDGTCIRDYIHVSDLADAHVLCAQSLMNGGPSAIYNLGCGGTGYSVGQIISVAESVTNRRIPVVHGPRRQGDPAILIASSRRIQKEMGWSPQRQSIRNIIESAWQWMQPNVGCEPYKFVVVSAE
jgi:UDP-glucose 4-epimerase